MVFYPKISDQFTLVVAKGGVTGRFVDLLDPFDPAVVPYLVYGSNTVVLKFKCGLCIIRTKAESASGLVTCSIKSLSIKRPLTSMSFLFEESASNHSR